jgi:HPt (histidine-containing phosphotransfer) domain-containing protein
MDPLDRNHLLDALDGDRDLVADVVRTFLETTPELVAATRQAVRLADSDGVRRSAHQLKGSLANVGAGPASRAAANLEAAGRSGAAESLPRARAALATEMERLMPEIQAMAGPGAPAKPVPSGETAHPIERPTG